MCKMEQNKIQKLERDLKQVKTAIILSFVLIGSLISMPIFLLLLFPSILFSGLIGLYVFFMIVYFMAISAVATTLLIFYILALVAEFNIEKVHDILLIVGFFFVVVGLVGLFLKSNYLKDEIAKLKMQPKETETKETIII